MRAPSRKDLLDEIVRLTSTNERLTRLVASQRPELDQLRRIEVGLREYLHNGALELERIHAECVALLPQDDDDLSSFEEIYGICSDGKARVDAALEALPQGDGDPRPASVSE